MSIARDFAISQTSDAGVVQRSRQEIRAAQPDGPALQIIPIQGLSLDLQHAEDVGPLPLGDLSALPIPFELAQDGIFGGANEERPDRFILLREHITNDSTECLPIVLARSQHEDIGTRAVAMSGGSIFSPSFACASECKSAEP